MTACTSNANFSWSKEALNRWAQCVAYIEVLDKDGAVGIGSCFHVGNGIFITAKHVIENKEITTISCPEWPYEITGNGHGRIKAGLLDGPFYHPNSKVDAACFIASYTPPEWIPLGGHLDDWIGLHTFLLFKTLVIGYPPVPCASEPVLIASTGEVNGIADLYATNHPHFLVSTTARGGFSGGPAIIAYNEEAPNGAAVLGLITTSLVRNSEPEQLGFLAVLSVEPLFTMLEHHEMLPDFQRIA